MANSTLSDHVLIFREALAPARCEALIERFESAPGHERCEREAGHGFAQIDVTQHWPDQNKILVPIFLSYFSLYQAAVDARFWPLKFSFEHVRLKRYLPNGRDCFPLHVDVMGQMAARQFMTAIVYLNHPEGGETNFPSLDLSIAPEPGKLIAFPPLWLFPHSGLPPRSRAKYILHTYLCYPDP